MFNARPILIAVSVGLVLSGCQATGEQYRSDVYSAGQVNTAQQVQTVEIIAIQPAKVAINNDSDQLSSQVVGGVLGGILGAVLGHQVSDRRSGTNIGAIAGAALGAVAGGEVSGSNSYVNGVQLTFRLNGRIFNSAQVGQMCEFKNGPAIMISTTPTNTRIQPNNPYGCGK